MTLPTLPYKHSTSLSQNPKSHFRVFSCIQSFTHSTRYISSATKKQSTKQKAFMAEHQDSILFQHLEIEKEGNDDSSSSSYTRDGTLDWHGKPALKNKSGGWGCGILVLLNLGLLTLSIAGVSVSMVLFQKSVLRQTNAEAANSFSNWIGTGYLFSLCGALLSDSPLGRFFTCVVSELFLIGKSVLRQTNAEAANSFSNWIGTGYLFSLCGALLSDSPLGRFFTCVVSELFLIGGAIVLSLMTHFLFLKPQGCGTAASPCDTPKPFELAIYYIAIYLIAFGSGAADPALAVLGADQFDEEDPDEKQSKASFYSYFYVSLSLGCLAAETGLAYVYSLGHWTLGFWLCTAASVVAYLLLLCGTLRYRHFKPRSGNPVSRFSQVIVASVRKITHEVPVNEQGLNYHQPVYEIGDASNRRILRTDGFRFLDRAAIVSPEDMDRRSRGVPPNPWRLCTVTQVEEVKCIPRLIPIWLCSIPSSLVFVQAMSLFLEQGSTMNTKVGKSFHFPPASMPVFDMATTSSFILLYRQLFLPLYVKLRNKREAAATSPETLNELYKMEIGLAFGIASMLVAGIAEQARLRRAISGSKEDTSSLSIFWLAPQYILVGVSEALVTVAQMDFFSAQSPDAMKSFGVGLSMVSTALGNYFNSLLLTVVMKITPHPGWVPPNLNQGHLDRFYFLSAAILLFDLGIFVVVAKKFKPISLEKR